MAWSLRSGCESQNFQTLEELRSQLRADVGTDVGAEDEVACFEREFHVSVVDETCATAADVDGKVSACTRKRAPRRDARTKQTAGGKKRASRRKRQSSDDESESDKVDVENGNVDAQDDENDAVDQNNNPNADDEPVDATTLEETDLSLAASTLVRDAKALCMRVSALATVLTDVQLAAANRSFAALVREVEKLQIAAYGGSQVIKKKASRKRVLRV
uniref:Late transcription factor VLTF-4 n=1 Tax=Rousettus bat poxvirus TaxID=3141933 RepID=A0AAU7E1R6_9POXV